jgi:hypothetical protein
MGDTVQLSEDQRERATKILDLLNEQKISYTDEIVEDWEYNMRGIEYSNLKPAKNYFYNGEVHPDREFIPVSKIAGTTHSRSEFKQHRLRRVLNWLIDGEFQVRDERPPTLEKYSDSYWVSMDGHHRVIAFKSIGIEEMFVRYMEVEMAE